MRKLLLTSIASLAIQSPGWAGDAEELGHHWEVPGYRVEMMTQIALMAGVAVIVVAGLWLAQTWRRKRARQ